MRVDAICLVDRESQHLDIEDGDQGGKTPANPAACHSIACQAPDSMRHSTALQDGLYALTAACQSRSCRPSMSLLTSSFPAGFGSRVKTRRKSKIGLRLPGCSAGHCRAIRVLFIMFLWLKLFKFLACDGNLSSITLVIIIAVDLVLDGWSCTRGR